MSMQLPELHNRFADALIEDVRFGPRRECTLILCPLVWHGQQGRAAERCVAVRFGGVNNLDAVIAFFASEPWQQSELRSLEYAPTPLSKIGRVYVHVAFERMDGQIVIECTTISITDEDPG
ncbi:MAG: hypothetical protein JOZ51_28430 [Chloroflexi bacterium]|nr:hypothetical protein [Chloroflexota bacterium]